MSSVEHGVGEDGQVFGGGEQSGVCGNAAENGRIFVLHFALNDAMAEAGIGGGGWDRLFQHGRGIESRMRQSERTEDFTLAEAI